MPKVTELTEDTTVGGAELLYCVDGTSDKQVAISTIRKYMLPSGMMQMFAGGSAPSGWLLCDGSEVDRTTYADLFSAIGTTWGTGNGVTTFNLPDMRGRAPIGAGTGSSLTTRNLADELGAETHTLTENEMPVHGYHGNAEHTIGNAQYDAGRLDALYDTSGGGITKGGGAAHNNMQPSTAVNFIIKT